MEIGTPGTPYSGRIELWWLAADKYRLQLTSSQFNQTRIVDGWQVQEANQGDYYPRWLEISSSRSWTPFRFKGNSLAGLAP